MANWWDSPASQTTAPVAPNPVTPAPDNNLLTYYQRQMAARPKWTPSDAPYSLSAPSLALSAPPDTQAPTAPEAKAPEAPGVLGSTWNALKGAGVEALKTTQSVGPALYGLADTATGGYLDIGRRRLQAGIQNALGDDTRWQDIDPMAVSQQRTGAMQDELKPDQYRQWEQDVAQQQGAWDKTKATLSHPGLMVGKVAGLAPYLLGGELGLGAKATTAGFGALMGGQSALDAQARVYDKPLEDLQKLPDYRPDQSEADNRARLAQQAARPAAALGAAAGVIPGAIAGKALHGPVTALLGGAEKVAASLPRTMAQGVLQQAPEFAAMNAGTTLAGNVGLRAVDPNQPLMENVPETVAEGLLVGGLSGMAVHPVMSRYQGNKGAKAYTAVLDQVHENRAAVPDTDLAKYVANGQELLSKTPMGKTPRADLLDAVTRTQQIIVDRQAAALAQREAAIADYVKRQAPPIPPEATLDPTADPYGAMIQEAAQRDDLWNEQRESLKRNVAHLEQLKQLRVEQDQRAQESARLEAARKVGEAQRQATTPTIPEGYDPTLDTVGRLPTSTLPPGYDPNPSASMGALGQLGPTRLGASQEPSPLVGLLGVKPPDAVRPPVAALEQNPLDLLRQTARPDVVASAPLASEGQLPNGPNEMNRLLGNAPAPAKPPVSEVAPQTPDELLNRPARIQPREGNPNAAQSENAARPVGENQSVSATADFIHGNADAADEGRADEVRPAESAAGQEQERPAGQEQGQEQEVVAAPPGRAYASLEEQQSAIDRLITQAKQDERYGVASAAPMIREAVQFGAPEADVRQAIQQGEEAITDLADRWADKSNGMKMGFGQQPGPVHLNTPPSRPHPADKYANWNNLTDDQVKAFAHAMGIRPKKNRESTLSAIDDARQGENIRRAWDTAFPLATTPIESATSPTPEISHDQRSQGRQAQAETETLLNQQPVDPTVPPKESLVGLSYEQLAKLKSEFDAFLDQYGDQHSWVRSADGKMRETIISNRNIWADYGHALTKALNSAPRPPQAEPPPRQPAPPDPRIAAIDERVNRQIAERQQQVDTIKAATLEKMRALKLEAQRRQQAGEDPQTIVADLGPALTTGKQVLDWLEQRAFEARDQRGYSVNLRAQGATLNKIPDWITRHVESVESKESAPPQEGAGKSPATTKPRQSYADKHEAPADVSVGDFITSRPKGLQKIAAKALQADLNGASRAEQIRNAIAGGATVVKTAKGRTLGAWTEKQLTKHGMDYAEALTAKKGEVVAPDQNAPTEKEGAGRLVIGATPLSPRIQEHRARLLEKARKYDEQKAADFAMRDVTPSGYGPTDPNSESYDPYAIQLSAEQKKIQASINEAKTILRGNISGEKRKAIQESLKRSQQKLEDENIKQSISAKSVSSTPESLAPPKAAPNESAKQGGVVAPAAKPADTPLTSHYAIYGDKVVAMDYVKKPADQFKLAGMRIRDNGDDGYVVTPKREVFRISQSNKIAKRVTDPVERQQALERLLAKSAAPVEPVAPDQVDKPAKATKAAKQRTSYADKIALRETDDLLTAIAKMGGIDQAIAKREGVDPSEFKRMPVFGKPLFRKTGGRGLDTMAEVLSEADYPVLDESGHYTVNRLLDQLDSALRGERIYTPKGYEDMAQRDAEDRQRQQEADDWALDDVELESSGFNELADSEQAIADWKINAREQLGVDKAESLFERIAEKSNAESEAEFLQELNDAYSREMANGSGGRGSSPRNAYEESGRAATGESPEDFSLSGYSQANLNARAAEVARAQAEQSAKDKAADQKAAADRARGDFVLSGSDRPADVAVAHGQQELAPAAEIPKPTAQNPNAAFNARQGDGGDAQLASRNEPTPDRTPPTREELTQHLKDAVGEKDAQALLDSGRVRIHDDDSTVPEASRPAGRFAASVDKDGVAHFVLSEMDAATAKGVLAHESGHIGEKLGYFDALDRPIVKVAHAVLRVAGLEGLIGKPTFDNLVEQTRALADKGVASAKDAQDWVNHLVEKGLLDSADAGRELVSYTLEYAPNNLPLVKRIVATIRAALYRMGVKMQLNEADLLALARSALKSAAREGRNELTRAGHLLNQMKESPALAGVTLREKPEPVTASRDSQADYSEDPATLAEFNRILAAQRAAVQPLTGGTDSRAFAEWFGDSAIKKRDGEPLPLYHGTSADFRAFDLDRGGSNTDHATAALGVFMTPNARDAGRYGDRTLPLYARIEKPYVVNTWDLPVFELPDQARAFRAQLQAKGYDGMVIKSGADPYVVAFDGKQVKSSENQGTWSRETGDIYASRPNPLRLAQAAADKVAARLPESAKEFGRRILEEAQLWAAPMAVGTARTQAPAKDYANGVRQTWYEATKTLERLTKDFTPKQHKAMWNGMDATSVWVQQAMNGGMDRDAAMRAAQAQRVGVFALPAAQRDAALALSTRADALWKRAKDAGMVQDDAQGLPFWTPRVAAIIGEDGSFGKPPGKNEGVQNPDHPGIGFTTTSPNLKHRGHVFAADSEAGMQKLFGDKAALVRDIRVMPLAMARLEQAIAGRELINQVKAIGKAIGAEVTSTSPKRGYFTLDHPAFQTFVPRIEKQANGAWEQVQETVTDVDGHTTLRPAFEKQPLYIAKEFEGPLRAVLNTRSGAIYQGLMGLKRGAMSLVMFSPMIHNAVIWGKAFPAMPGKMITGKIYFEGNRAKRDPSLMKEAIGNGLAPINSGAFHPDVPTGLNSLSGHDAGLISTALSKGVGLVNKSAGAALAKGLDQLGGFWHNTMLWDRVADLQMGLYVNLKQHQMDKGLDAQSAGRVAAHFANRYAGAIPQEAMGEGARRLGNLALFSRSFTLGNLAIMKDMLTGLPQDVKAQILRDAGQGAMDQATAAARKKAWVMLAADIGLMYVGNAMLQGAVDKLKLDKSLDEIGQGYARRLDKALKAADGNPLQLVNPWSAAFLPDRLSPGSEHEPGKEDRIFTGRDPRTGTASYTRLPTGKVGEELLRWPTRPLEMLRKKQSTLLRPTMEIFANRDHFNNPVYDADAPGLDGMVQRVGQVVGHFLSGQAPVEEAGAAYRSLTGQAVTGDTLKWAGPLMGFTAGRGYPGGPELGAIATAERRHADEIKAMRPEIKRLVDGGQVQEAVRKMTQLGMSPTAQRALIVSVVAPQSRLNSGALMRFYRNATVEEKAKLQDVIDAR